MNSATAPAKATNRTNRKQTCFPNRHMRPEEYALWDVSRKLAHGTGVLYFDGREMAKLFADTKKDCMYRIARGLVESGWFEVIAAAARDKRTGLYSCTQYHVLSPEEWAKKHPHVCRQPAESSLEIQTGNQSVNRDRHQSGNPESPVWKSRTSSLEIQTYSDKENLDKEIVRGNEAAMPSLPDEDEGAETDYDWIALRMASESWPTTRKTDQMVRSFLKEGHPKEDIWQAIWMTMDDMPKSEQKPGLYLAQNLKGKMLFTADKSCGEIAGQQPTGRTRANLRPDGTEEGELPRLPRSTR